MYTEAQFFKILADPTRLRLAVMLSIMGEMCVCELVEALGEPQYKVSRHLGIMRSENLVKARRDGTWMHYSLRKPSNELEKCLLDCFRDCLKAHPTIRSDLKRLRKAECVR